MRAWAVAGLLLGAGLLTAYVLAFVPLFILVVLVRTLGLSVGRRRQKHALNQAQHGRGGADSERQGQDRN